MVGQLRQLILRMTQAALVVGVIACQPTSPVKKIRSAHSNWIEEHFQTEITNIGLEKLGYQIEKPKEIDYPAIYLSVANGDLDYSVINSEKAHVKFFENAGGKKKLERVGVLTPNVVQGYQIDKMTGFSNNSTSPFFHAVHQDLRRNKTCIHCGNKVFGS